MSDTQALIAEAESARKRLCLLGLTGIAVIVGDLAERLQQSVEREATLREGLEKIAKLSNKPADHVFVEIDLEGHPIHEEDPARAHWVGVSRGMHEASILARAALALKEATR